MWWLLVLFAALVLALPAAVWLYRATRYLVLFLVAQTCALLAFLCLLLAFVPAFVERLILRARLRRLRITPRTL